MSEHLDHTTLDWDLVARGVYSLHQTFRYEYDAPIRDLRHRLVVLPPPRHGDQRRLERAVRVEGADAEVVEHRDQFGNVVIDVRAPVVEAAVEFDVRVRVERSVTAEPARVPAVLGLDPRLRRPTDLTRPDGRLVAWAHELGAPGGDPLAVADRVSRAVHAALAYDLDATDVRTTAARALALGRGVCQDHAHVMLAVCRELGLAARYVSGHLVGQGGTHAWVEVVVPSPTAPDRAVAVAFDPTHGRRAGLAYVTVAVGRDYRDVAPTSGSYASPVPGRLVAHRHLGVTSVE